MSALAALSLCAMFDSDARAQDFPDPTETAPTKEETSIFGPKGRRGFGKRPPNPFRVTLNAYTSNSGTIQRGLGTFGGVDVQYDAFTSRLLGGPTLVGFFADLNGGEQYDKRESALFDMRVIGFGVMARRIFTETPERRHFYIGAGAGFYTTRLNIDPAGPQRYEETDGSFGFRFQGGYQFTKNFYAQLDLLTLDLIRTRDADGRFVRANPSGARFGVGYQF